MAVVPYVGEPGGTAGTDYTVFIAEDKEKVSQDQVAWLGEVLGDKGGLIFMGGVPGNQSTPGFFNPFVEAVEKTGMTMLVDKPVDTNWDPGQEQRVMAGLISKYDKIDGLASDYGVASGGGLRAFVNADEPHPPLATNASDNNLGCEWLKYTQAVARFPAVHARRQHPRRALGRPPRAGDDQRGRAQRPDRLPAVSAGRHGEREAAEVQSRPAARR